MHLFELKEADSTNTWVATHRSELPMPSLVYALSQTAGRGQRGNSWESASGKNLCATALLRPEGIAPQKQFVISEAVALAVADLLEVYDVEAKVKWPNDIYVGDRKICGILIEHAVMPGEILYTIAGIGVNLNQDEFISDAPNPVSLTQLTGGTYDIAEAAGRLALCIERRMEEARLKPATLHAEFMKRLWRGDGGVYPFYDRLRGEHIEAVIEDVAPDGIITLRIPGGDECRSYAFKEVEFVIKPN